MSESNRPPGKTTIAPGVLLTIAKLTTLQVEGVNAMSRVPGGVNRIFRRGHADGVRIDIDDDRVYADLYVVLERGYNLREVSRSIQREVARSISEMVGMAIGQVNVHIEDIHYPMEIQAEA